MASSSNSPATPPRKHPTLSPSLPIPPPSSIPEPVPYDVFLSFRGIDTRNNFTGYLYDRLEMAGIRTFMDNHNLPIGGEISIELMRAMEDSRIYIVVFSKNYASSRWCLDELLEITKCFTEKSGREVIPVFYDVKPYEVRWQSGVVGEAFKIHESRHFEKVERWRAALTEVASLFGYDLENNTLGRSESRLINLIIKEVLARVKSKKLIVAEHPVGLDSRLLDLLSLISFKSDVCQMVGIWGMGGLGKTEIAKALYNEIHHRFPLSCFLENVRKVSKEKRLVHLQEQLISELLNVKEAISFWSDDQGISFIKTRFSRKNVLIVLDDLDDVSQVNALAGDRDWFGAGSVIIITTRDRHLLNQLRVDAIYEAKELNYKESLELFSWHSVQKESPNEPYCVIADKIVAYSCGLPLALKVLGSSLVEYSVGQWKSALEKIQKAPHVIIQQTLKISYDGLDEEQRDIFLDIACFFIDADKDHVTYILNGCDFSTEFAIRILIDRCLLTVNKNNKLRMHDLIRDMGREVIRLEYPKKPGKRSRLWIHQDVIDVLRRKMGTEMIEGVTLVFP